MSPPAETQERAKDVLGLRDLQDGARALPVRVEQLWRLDHYARHVPFTGSIFIPLPPAPDMGIFREALARVVDRHEALHSRLAIADGRPVLVEARGAPELELVSVTRAQVQAHRPGGPASPISEFIDAPIDLFTQTGLRCRAFQDEDGRVALGILQHHFYGDAWSAQVLRQEFQALHAALATGAAAELPPVVQYTNYALTQRRALADNLSTRLGYWHKRLGAAPPARFPHDHAQSTGQVGQMFFAIADSATQKMTAIAKAERVSMPMIALAVYQLTLARWSGQRQILTASNTADRINPRFRNTIGFLTTTMPVYSEIADGVSFRDFLRGLAKDYYDAYPHRDISTELYDAIFAPAQPFCTTLFNYIPLQKDFFPGDLPSAPSTAGVLMGPPGPRPALYREAYLCLVEYPQGLIGKLMYNCDVFTAATMEQFSGLYQEILQQAVDDPATRLAALV